MQTLREGAAFPDFSLPDQDGRTVDRASLAGRPFVVYFYPKDDTPGCTNEAKDFSEVADAFGELDVPVLGVSPDPVAKHARFAGKHDLRVRLLSDETRVLIEGLGLWVEKSMYGKTFWGTERTSILVDGDGTIRQVWPKVRVEGHAAAVLDAVRALVTK